MKKGVLIFMPVVSGALCTLSLPAFDYYYLGWFGLVPLFLAINIRDKLSGVITGFLFGYIFGIVSFFWLSTTESVSLSQFVLVVVPTFSLPYIAFGILYSLIRPGAGSWMVLAAPALWVAIEYARAHLFFLALPWNFLGHSQYTFLPLVQLSEFTGVYGISFLIVMVNQIITQALARFLPDKNIIPIRSYRLFYLKRLTLGIVVLSVLVFTYYCGWLRNGEHEMKEKIRVALVQPSVLAHDNMTAEEQASHMEIYEDLTNEAAKFTPALIVWPSSSLPAPITSRLVRKKVQEIARNSKTHILVGGAGVEKFSQNNQKQVGFSNSEFLFGPFGRGKTKYNKIKLVPFDEYLPLEGFIKWPTFITSLKQSFIRGKEYMLFKIGDARFGTPICWESMFSDVFRQFVKEGANFMVAVTNEGYTGRTSAPYQTLAMTVFRAVENRVEIARAGTTGISCFINARGEIVDRVQDENGDDLFVSGILVRDVSLSDKKTFYTLYGDVFAYICISYTLLLILASIYVRLRQRQMIGVNNDN